MSTFDDLMRAYGGNKILATTRFAVGLAAFDPSDPFRRGYSRANALNAAEEMAGYEGITFDAPEWAAIARAFDAALPDAE
jgi:hypothetical protein